MLYHRLPEPMYGSVLYPLNQLKKVYPQAYKEAAKKYVGRMELLKDIIPGLNCLWNDVLHLTPLDPKSTARAYESAGGKWSPYRWVVIKPESLDPAQTVIYLYQYSDRKDKFTPGNFVPYNPDLLKDYVELPQHTKDYYKEQLAAGNKPLLYFRVPHVLYRGALDIGEHEIIEC